ncbi:MAG: hypothetical protein U0R26_03470 [Solirubrobacterales bacterium]
MASAAVTVARGSSPSCTCRRARFSHCSPAGAGRLFGALLRADIESERALLALVVRDLIAHGLTVSVLKRRLGWVAERRALFGALPPDAPGAYRHTCSIGSLVGVGRTGCGWGSGWGVTLETLAGCQVPTSLTPRR